jgi:hypothetical protein
MQAEEKKEVETTSLESWVKRQYESLSQKSLYSYVFVIGLIVLAILAFSWWQGMRAGKRASLWIDLERLDTREKLKKFAEENRGEVVGDIARLRIARMDIGSDGLMQLGTRDQEQRNKAITNLVEGRKVYLEVAPQLKKYKSFEIEAWVGAGRAEESLIGASGKDGESSLGNADKALEYYQKALALLGESEEGKQLKEYIDNFKTNKDQIVKSYTDFYASLKPIEPIKIETPKKEEPKKDEKKEEKKEEPKKDEKKEEKKEEPKKDEKK